MSIHNNPDSTNILLKNIAFTLNTILTEQKKVARLMEEWFYRQKPEKASPLTAQQQPKQPKPPPAFLRAEHVAKVLDISHRSADRVLRQIRRQAGLAPRTPVSPELFSEAKGISIREILRVLTD